MSSVALQPSAGVPEGGEVSKLFVPVPERVSQFLELKSEEVEKQMSSQKGRMKLFDQLMEHEADLTEQYPGFNAEHLRTQIDEIGKTLAARQRFTKEMEPKKGLLRRMLSGAGSFAIKNPVTTLLLVLAAAAGGVGLSAYMAGGMESLLARVGLSHLYGTKGAAEAAESMGKLIEAGKQLLPDTYGGPTGPLKE